MRDIGVGDLLQQVIDTVEACPLLVVAFHDMPRSFGIVGARKGLFLRFGLTFPADA